MGEWQCDQMVNFLIFGNLQKLKVCIIKFFLQKLVQYFTKNPKRGDAKDLIILPLWRNFIKSGHTGGSEMSETFLSKKSKKKAFKCFFQRPPRPDPKKKIVSLPTVTQG